MNNHEVVITTRDRLMKAWQSSMELVRDYKHYAQEENDSVSNLFNEFAEEIGIQSSKLREMLLEDQNSASEEK